MKRLSKTQKEIEELASQVPAITSAQYAWARANANYFVAVVQGTQQIRCPNCNHTFDKSEAKSTKSKWNSTDKTYTCPDCGAQIQVRVIPDSCRSKGQKNIIVRRKQEEFFQVMNAVGGWQVTRLVYMRRNVYVRKPSTEWEFFEVCQAWNNPKEKTTYFRALPKVFMASYRFNPYSLYDYVAVRDENGNYQYDKQGYVICKAEPRELEARRAGGENYFETYAVAPTSRILPYYKQRGITAKVDYKEIGRNAMQIFEIMAQGVFSNVYETLFKAKEWELFRTVASYRHKANADKFFSAWKICQRNHYKPKDKTEWIDLVDMLIDCQMDYRNPKYVCPADLHEMHQRVLARKEKVDEERELAKNMEKDMEYRERIAKYLDMDIANKDLTIVVLHNIPAFKAEADHLHHCVYRCHYYTHEDSLILSARDSSGKRWETLEVDIPTLRIKQCYGYGDKFTERHDEILNLMKENMWQVRERRDGVRARLAS